MSGDFDKMRCTDNFSAYISEYVKDASGWTALPAAATEQEAKTSKPDPSELSTAKHVSKPGDVSDPIGPARAEQPTPEDYASVERLKALDKMIERLPSTTLHEYMGGWDETRCATEGRNANGVFPMATQSTYPTRNALMTCQFFFLPNSSSASACYVSAPVYCTHQACEKQNSLNGPRVQVGPNSTAAMIVCGEAGADGVWRIDRYAHYSQLEQPKQEPVEPPAPAEDANARTERLHQANKLLVEPYEKALIAQLTKREAKIFTENCSVEPGQDGPIVSCDDDNEALRLWDKFSKTLKRVLLDAAPVSPAETREVAVNPPICETVIVKQVWPADAECVAGTETDDSGISPRDGDLHGCSGAGSGGISYTNGQHQTGSYAYVPAMENSQPGDKVRLCLVSVYVGCPPDDDRGQTFTAYNFRTHGKWRKPNANHICGGA